MTTRLYTVKEAQALLSLGKTTIYDLIRAGEIESVLIGSTRRIPSDSLEAYIARLRAA